jgi:hypothetical protein
MSWGLGVRGLLVHKALAEISSVSEKHLSLVRFLLDKEWDILKSEMWFDGHFALRKIPHDMVGIMRPSKIIIFF